MVGPRVSERPRAAQGRMGWETIVGKVASLSEAIRKATAHLSIAGL